jgi:hypothetical protein
MRLLLRSIALAIVLAGPLADDPALAAMRTPCVGDCHGDGSDTIGSLVTMVGIALGTAPLSACPHGVPSGAAVTVALLIQAVDNALGGCPALQATPTATPAVSDTATPTATIHAGRITCPAGQHRACHGGSGRGGGYHTTCTCVDDPPPVCVTTWGTRILLGTSTVLYDTYTVYAPDTCAAHGTLVTCGPGGVIEPPGATGYTVCRVLTDEPSPE